MFFTAFSITNRTCIDDTRLTNLVSKANPLFAAEPFLAKTA